MKYLKKAGDIRKSILNNMERFFKSYDDSQPNTVTSSASAEQVKLYYQEPVTRSGQQP